MSFIYKITEKETGKFYIGSRYSKNCDPSDMLTTYFTSSKIVAPMIHSKGIDAFECVILSEGLSVDDTLILENEMIAEVLFDNLCLNQQAHVSPVMWNPHRIERSPWDVPRYKHLHHVWGMSHMLWLVVEDNPDHIGDGVSRKMFYDTFNDGKSKKLFKRIHDMLKDGWRPLDDPEWVDEFGSVNIPESELLSKLNNIPVPWERRRSNSVQQAWSLAHEFWLISHVNPEHNGNGVCRKGAAKILADGKYSSIFKQMITMFKEGWRPMEDPRWTCRFVK